VQQTFDKLHRLKEMKAISQGSPILDKSFRYTRSGDIAELHDALDRSASFAYKYDALDRVTSAAQVEGALKEDFRYDAFGNRATSQLVPEAQAFNAQNRFAPSTNLTYGPSGEMTFDGHHRYAYTAEGYIGSVDDGAVKFVFDAEGNRIEKIVGEFVTDYVWLDGQLLAEKKPDGTWIDYIYAKGDRIAATTTAPSSSDGSYVAQGTTYFLADRLGLARVAVSGQGQLVSQGDFAPFGTELRDRTAESAGNLHSAASISFTGEVHDEETGLDTYKFRSYNAELGRWMSPDPSSLHYATLANPQGFNLYSYVTNDPLKYIDVDGLMEYDCDEDDDCSDCSDCGDCSDCYSDDGGGGGDGGGDSGNNGDEGDPSGPEATFYLTVYAGYISVSADPDPALDPTPLFLYTYVPPVDPSDGDVPVHGLWTYGNWCGAGGSGTPINATDAACMQHDVCYGSFTFGANYLGTNATLQGCNQILCNAVRGRATALIGQAQANAAAIGYNTSRGFSPGQFLTPDQYNELVADSDINLLFTSLVLPGNSCQ
jgi:RHS repeat-associated protein